MSQFPWSRDEETAFVDAARSVPAELNTACPGWTAHDVLAHAVAGGAEIGRLIERHLAGADVGSTTRFEDREPTFRAVAYDDLTELVAGEGIFDLLVTMSHATARASLPFTGWEMDADTLALHVRSELALHRWDLVGTDSVSRQLLDQWELTAHAVRALNHFDIINERAINRTRTMLQHESAVLTCDCEPTGISMS